MLGGQLMEEAGGMVPRVLVVQRPPDVDDVEVAIALDGPEAITRATTEAFDALLLDLSLPVLDGWFVLAALGDCPQRPRIVAIATDLDDVMRAVSLGADQVVDHHDVRAACSQALCATA
ncbi:MAG TPA: response regulator [Acidimicrobiia bacterium]|jgi:CheY-like chemotaxis protein|nr:response regulator [Acidimicrobiia bacterium]